MFTNLLHAFTHHVKTRPNDVALVVPAGDNVVSLSWRQLADKVVAQADALNQRFEDQPTASRSVGYASDNSIGDVLTALACPLVNALEVPVDHRLGDAANELAGHIGGLWLEQHDLTNGRVSGSAKSAERLSKATSKIQLKAPALVVWTSGTTDDPKAVTLTHRNLLGNAQAKLKAVPNSASDVRLTSLPLCHAYARTCDMGMWLISGGALALGLGLDAWHTLGPRVRPTVANTVPSLAQRIFATDPELLGIDRLRLLGCGGAAMSKHDFLAWRDRGVTVIQGYGLTESSPVICSATPENATAGLVGTFVDGWIHEIRGGRLFVRGPHVMAGYWNDVNATNHRIVDGWLDTGDLVEIDLATRQLRILGRADDVIVLENGHKVHPQSIERQIEQIEGVRHALVVGTGRTIEVWLDADVSRKYVGLIQAELSDRPRWERPAAVHLFDLPLARKAGELTAKGTIRRERVQRLVR